MMVSPFVLAMSYLYSRIAIGSVQLDSRSLPCIIELALYMKCSESGFNIILLCRILYISVVGVAKWC